MLCAGGKPFKLNDKVFLIYLLDGVAALRKSGHREHQSQYESQSFHFFAGIVKVKHAYSPTFESMSMRP